MLGNSLETMFSFKSILSSILKQVLQNPGHHWNYGETEHKTGQTNKNGPKQAYF